eukprot:342895-Pelagomonas_calceolata.AAC.3
MYPVPDLGDESWKQSSQERVWCLQVIGVVDRNSIKLQSKLGGFMSVKTILYKGLQSAWGVDDPVHT